MELGTSMSSGTRSRRVLNRRRRPSPGTASRRRFAPTRYLMPVKQRISSSTTSALPTALIHTAGGSWHYDIRPARTACRATACGHLARLRCLLQREERPRCRPERAWLSAAQTALSALFPPKNPSSLRSVTVHVAKPRAYVQGRVPSLPPHRPDR